jgi:uncharacterized protein (TIGR00252 family)
VIIKTTEQGQKAEGAVSELLEQQGFEIIDRNWKTKVCEIDLIAQNNKTVFFIEVKYRGSNFQGDGFEYITAKKQKQMDFAAKVWCQAYDWNNDYRLMAAAVSGANCGDIELIELS